MLYVIVDSENPEDVLFVKANNREQIQERMKIKPTERICGGLTTKEFELLDSIGFGVISG